MPSDQLTNLLELCARRLYVQRRCVWFLTGLLAIASCCISLLAILLGKHWGTWRCYGGAAASPQPFSDTGVMEPQPGGPWDEP